MMNEGGDAAPCSVLSSASAQERLTVVGQMFVGGAEGTRAYHPDCKASLISWEHFFFPVLLFLFVVGVYCCACVRVGVYAVA